MNNRERHDIRLGDWGPYFKKYAGISHITDKKRGLRFDLCVFPALYRRRMEVPNACWDSGFHPWEASTGLENYSYRFDITGHDKVFCDIAYSEVEADTWMISGHITNRLKTKQGIEMQYVAWMNFPFVGRATAEEIMEPVEVELPEGGLWLHALDYEDLVFVHSKKDEGLTYDGMFKGEERKSRVVDGAVLGKEFGKTPGDFAVYRLRTEAGFRNAVMLFKGRPSGEAPAVFSVSGSYRGNIRFDHEGCYILHIGPVPAGEVEIVLCSEGGGALELEGIALLEEEKADTINFNIRRWKPVPYIEKGPAECSVLLKYPDSEVWYGILWEMMPYKIKEYLCDSLDLPMKFNNYDNVLKSIKGKGDGHFTCICTAPVVLEPCSEKEINGIVCAGSKDEVMRKLQDWQVLLEKRAVAERIKQSFSDKNFRFNCSKNGERYLLSQQLMAACILTNIVFPTYLRRSYVRHYTPGRWWDCIYTWDSGFIGLGLLELDAGKAEDCLRAYLTEENDRHAAFIHHGTPVPTQIYLYLELWNRTLSEEMLRELYPSVRQYYRFLSGRAHSSGTRKFLSGMLCTWDYFYNSTGWDDYPPQVHVHEHGLENSTAPVGNTAHAIRTAKILIMVAEKLCLEEDIQEYEEDIRIFSRALEYAWDKESGYYGYLVHTENGSQKGILKTDSGENYNMGLDGVYPIITGVCNNEITGRLISHLKDEKELWTDIGISAVDRTSPYYSRTGYWNGTVWMPHQWFIWKTMLDIGETDFAWKIADTALNVWKKETDSSYNCYEYFIIETEQGAGWHQFTGLSTPVTSWFCAYYMPGRISCGFDIMLEHAAFSDDCYSVEGCLRLGRYVNEKACILVCMKPAVEYAVYADGVQLPFSCRLPGVLEIDFPKSGQTVNFVIKCIIE